MAIQLRRGDYDDLDTSQLLDGELAAVLENDPNTEDGTALYVSFGNDNVQRVVTSDEQVEIPVADEDTAGIVKPDGTTITVDSDGTIHGADTVPIATASTAGKVKPDGTSITVSADGTIHSSQADWKQNDPNGVGFIRNRPFYDRETEVLCQATSEQMTLPSSSEYTYPFLIEGLSFSESLVIGDDYVLTVGDDEFDFTYANGGAQWFFDNGRVYSYSLYLSANGGSLRMNVKPGDALTLPSMDVILRHVTSELMKIPAKYLPIPNNVVGAVKPDNTTITMDQDGTIHGATAVTVDSALSTSSANPVQNSAVATAIKALQDAMANAKALLGQLGLDAQGNPLVTAAQARASLDAAQSNGATGTLKATEDGIADLAGSLAVTDVSPATANHALGSHFMVGNELRRATSAIAAGEAISSSNTAADTLQGQIDTLRDSVSSIRAETPLCSYGVYQGIGTTINLSQSVYEFNYILIVAGSSYIKSGMAYSYIPTKRIGPSETKYEILHTLNGSIVAIYIQISKSNQIIIEDTTNEGAMIRQIFGVG